MLVAAYIARALFEPSMFGRTLNDLPLPVIIALEFAQVNLFLGVFNFLPIPPLDGSALLERALPAAWLPRWHRFAPYGIVLLFALVFWVGLGFIIDPFRERLFSFMLQ
jgi:Zn-dependent protease